MADQRLVDLGDLSCNTAQVREYLDDRVEYAVRAPYHWCVGKPRWSAVMDVLGCGSGFAFALRWLQDKPDLLDYIASFGEVIDNAATNVESGCDYTKQEAFSTHIQDIAIRNVLKNLGMCFRGEPDNILTIRSRDTNGYIFSPGRVPFLAPGLITHPSLCPTWAQKGSVEDFWQSNKYIEVFA